MASIEPDLALLSNIKGKTVVITGAVGGIGIEIVRLYASHGAKVVVADLENLRFAAESLIATLPDPSKVILARANILVWSEMKELFKMAIKKFGSVEVVVANAGVMESRLTLGVETVDTTGDLLKATGRPSVEIGTSSYEGKQRVLLLGYKTRVLKLGLLRSAGGNGYVHRMSFLPRNSFPDGSRGSIVLVISTSGYVGGTGVAAYVSSKHAITGLLRSSQDPERRGACSLICGPIIREMEFTQKALLGQWLGHDVAHLMASVGSFFASIGGYPLPNLEAMR